MNNEKKLELLDMALEDFHEGRISQKTAVEVIFSIFQGLGKITQEHIDWGRSVINKKEENI